MVIKDKTKNKTGKKHVYIYIGEGGYGLLLLFNDYFFLLNQVFTN